MINILLQPGEYSLNISNIQFYGSLERGEIFAKVTFKTQPMIQDYEIYEVFTLMGDSDDPERNQGMFEDFCFACGVNPSNWNMANLINRIIKARVGFVIDGCTSECRNYIEKFEISDVLPVGNYELLINKTEIKETDNKQSMCVRIHFSIQGPIYQDRNLWKDFVIRSPDQKREANDRAEFKELCLACGFDGPLLAPDDLCNHTVMASISINNYIEKFCPIHEEE